MRSQIDDIVLLTIIQNQLANKINNYSVKSDVNGDVLSTDVLRGINEYAQPNFVTLESFKYPNVTFYANYFNDSEDSIIYRFSSGIILDSSTETPQYKIVFASYNVKTAKVTFVEKVLA